MEGLQSRAALSRLPKMVRSTLLHFSCESGPSGKFSDLTDLRDIDHFIVKFKLHSYIWFQAPDFVILESKLCFSGVVSNFQVVIQSASSNATVHPDRGSKFRDFQFSVFLREPRASFSGISTRSCAKQIVSVSGAKHSPSFPCVLVALRAQIPERTTHHDKI